MTNDLRPAPKSGVAHDHLKGLVDGTTPYPWPFDGRLDASRLALIIVMPNGPEPGISREFGDAALAAITELAVAVTQYGSLVIRVPASGSRKYPEAAEETTKLKSELEPWSPPKEFQFSALELPAFGTSAFFGSNLDWTLRRARITHLLITGLPIETTVHSTMREANDQGYECLLVHDATAALDMSMMSRTLSMVEMSGGIFGAVGTRQAVISALLK